MKIQLTREVQRRQYRVVEREGGFYLSVLWDDSPRLDQPMGELRFENPLPTLEQAQAGVHLPSVPTWTQSETGWETEVMICHNGGGALAADELEAVRRAYRRRPS